jgi:hypothetical protein
MPVGWRWNTADFTPVFLADIGIYRKSNRCSATEVMINGNSEAIRDTVIPAFIGQEAQNCDLLHFL